MHAYRERVARVVVVGAGVGGLAAAARLGKLGHRVTVVEQSGAVGGKLGWFERDGFGFDTGPSLLTMPHVFSELFAATGAPISSRLDVVPVEPIASYRFADGSRLESSRDQNRFRTSLDTALQPGSGDDWARLFEQARRMWRATAHDFLESPGPPSLPRLALRRPLELGVVRPWQTLRGLGERQLRDPRLRMFLDRYATYSGSDPRRAPAALATVPYAEQAFGAWYITGGLHRLAIALAERVIETGGEIQLGCDASAIHTTGGRADGVQLGAGPLLAADVVVANVDAAHLYRDLLPRPQLRPGGEPSLSGFVLLLGVHARAGATPPAHHTVLFPAAYDGEFDAVFSGRPAGDPTIYISVPPDPALAPAGHEAWFVLVNAPRQGPYDWDAPGAADSYADLVLHRMAERGVDIRDRIVLREIRTPADLARTTRADGGAIYGTSSNGARAAFLRPANRSPVPGLFLVGGSAHPGGGLPLVALSARAVAGLVGPA